jgi:hypothetical protein
MISHNGCGVILSGYKFIDIGLDREWTDIVASHSISCSQPTLRLIGNTKKGYELIDHYQCSWCKRKFEKRASRDVTTTGEQTSTAVTEQSDDSTFLPPGGMQQTNLPTPGTGRRPQHGTNEKREQRKETSRQNILVRVSLRVVTSQAKPRRQQMTYLTSYCDVLHVDVPCSSHPPRGRPLELPVQNTKVALHDGHGHECYRHLSHTTNT